MRVKGSVLYVVLALFLGTYFYARTQVEMHRSHFNYRLHAAALPMPPLVVEALAGEFKGLVANYLLLEAASFIGSRQAFNAEPQDWIAVARLLDQSSRLDPYFKHTYILTQGTLPWHAQRFDETIAILERSKKHLPWDWLPGFFIGFNYHFFLKDNLTASQKLMEASKVPNAPLPFATLAARLASQSGQTRAAIDFLTSMHEKTEDEQTKATLEKRIMALNGVEVLQMAVDRFRVQFGRAPEELDELVNASIISALPTNPYDRPFSLSDGKVDF